MNEYEVTVSSTVEVYIKADSEEDAKQIAMEKPEVGEALLSEAYASAELTQLTGLEVKHGNN